MSRNIVLLCLLLVAAPLVADTYVCPPCGCSLDTKEFTEAGTCPVCEMSLVRKEDAPRATVRSRRSAGPSDLYAINVRKIKDGIYVASRPDPLRTFVEGNVTIIVNRDDVVVVDAGGAPVAARNIIAEVKRLTPNPVRYVVNSHFHYDHTLGNQEWLKAYPAIEIIAHEATRTSIVGGSNDSALEFARGDLEPRIAAGEATIERIGAEAAPGHQNVIAQMQQYFYDDIFVRQEAYREAVITPPTTTFTDSVVIHRPSRRIEIRHIGHGDTAGDAIVFLPDDKVVITGDMVVHPVPYGYSTEPRAWRKTLGNLDALDFEVLIPGHGEPQTGKTYLRALMTMLDRVHEQMTVAVAQGVDLETARGRIDVTEFEKKWIGDDPIRRYYFRRYFLTPSSEQAWRAAGGQ